MMRKLYQIVCAAILISFPAAVSAAPGTESMPFSRVSKDPVASGMGGAGLVSTSDIAYAAYRNAAAIPFSGRTLDVSAGYQRWQPSAAATDNVSAAAAWNIGGKFGVAVGFTCGMGQKYALTDASGKQDGSFSPEDMQFGAGFSWRFADWMSAGVNVRYVGNTLAKSHTYKAVSSDIFLMSEFSGFKVAAGVSSVGSKVKSASGVSYSLPASAAAGLGYSHDFAKTHRIDVLADADFYFSGAVSAAAGVSYTFKDMVSVRAGYRYGDKSVVPSFFSVGAGLRLFGVTLNLAYVIPDGNTFLGNSVTAGIGYCF